MWDEGNASTFQGYWEDTRVAFGLRGNWHVDMGIPNLDLYLGLSLGYMVWTVDRTYNTNTKLGFNYDTLYYGFCAGGRYFFTDNIGVTLELGYSLTSFVRLGLALKF